MRDLCVEYLDLYLVHWPARLIENGTNKLFPVDANGTRNVDWECDQAETWRQIEALLQKGKVKAIGVSNFSEILLERLERTWKVVPAVNQVELHPYNPQHSLRKYCQSKGIIMEAFSPLGSTNQKLLEVADKYHVPPARILLSWLANHGVVVLPKSVTPSRIEQNREIIRLAPEDMDLLDNMAEGGKQQRIMNPTPPWLTDFGFADWFGPGNANVPAEARLLAGPLART